MEVLAILSIMDSKYGWQSQPTQMAWVGLEFSTYQSILVWPT